MIAFPLSKPLTKQNGAKPKKTHTASHHLRPRLAPVMVSPLIASIRMKAPGGASPRLSTRHASARARSHGVHETGLPDLLRMIESLLMYGCFLKWWSSILIGFSIIFTIHFGVPLISETSVCAWETFLKELLVNKFMISTLGLMETAFETN